MHILGIIMIGLVIGILARIITPGPNPRGIIVTIVIGIVGAVAINCTLCALHPRLRKLWRKVLRLFSR